MLPGLGVGGYCLTKDPLLASWARATHDDGASKLQQSERAVEINDRMPEHTYEQVQAALEGDVDGKTVALLGVSYRKDVGDTRFTPAEYLYDLLDENGATIRLHDPFVECWDEQDRRVQQDLDDVISPPIDAVIFSTPHSSYTENGELQRHLHALPNRVLVHDAWGVLGNGEIGALQSKHRVQVTGRGDLDVSSTSPLTTTSSLNASSNA
jgi:UDP-N-acetyl-D-mannosaminuronate dehydrogenase